MTLWGPLYYKERFSISTVVYLVCKSVHRCTCVYLTQSDQSRNPDGQKQQRALRVPGSHPADHNSLNDLNKPNCVDTSPKIWHEGAKHHHNLPFGRCQKKPSGNRSVPAPAWRIPELWWKTSPGKCLRRKSKKVIKGSSDPVHILCSGLAAGPHLKVNPQRSSRWKSAPHREISSVLWSRPGWISTPFCWDQSLKKM